MFVPNHIYYCELELFWKQKMYERQINQWLYIAQPQCIGTIVGLILSEIFLYFQINQYLNVLLQKAFIFLLKFWIDIQIN